MQYEEEKWVKPKLYEGMAYKYISLSCWPFLRLSSWTTWSNIRWLMVEEDWYHSEVQTPVKCQQIPNKSTFQSAIWRNLQGMLFWFLLVCPILPQVILCPALSWSVPRSRGWFTVELMKFWLQSPQVLPLPSLMSKAIFNSFTYRGTPNCIPS